MASRAVLIKKMPTENQATLVIRLRSAHLQPLIPLRWKLGVELRILILAQHILWQFNNGLIKMQIQAVFGLRKFSGRVGAKLSKV